MWGGEWGVLSGQVWEAEQVEHRGKSLGPECKVGCEVGRCVQKTSWQMRLVPRMRWQGLAWVWRGSNVSGAKSQDTGAQQQIGRNREVQWGLWCPHSITSSPKRPGNHPLGP